MQLINGMNDRELKKNGLHYVNFKYFFDKTKGMRNTP